MKVLFARNGSKFYPLNFIVSISYYTYYILYFRYEYLRSTIIYDRTIILSLLETLNMDSDLQRDNNTPVIGILAQVYGWEFHRGITIGLYS